MGRNTGKRDSILLRCKEFLMLEFGLSLAEFAIYEFVTKKEWEGRDGKARQKGKRKKEKKNR